MAANSLQTGHFLERLAGRFILLWGWRRALVAFLAGALCGSRRRRPTISSRSASSPFRFWSGCSTAPRSSVRPGFCAACVRHSRSAGGSASAISSPGCGGSAAPCWSRPTASPGRCRSRSSACRPSSRSSTVWRRHWRGCSGPTISAASPHLPPSFALLEWLRTFLFTGFPWNPVGYAAMPTPLLMQSVSVVGMIGMNALAVFVFAMPALLAGHRNVRVGAGACPAARRRTCRLRLFQARPAPTRRRSAACQSASSSRRSIRPPSSTSTSRDEIFRTLLNLSAAPLAARRRQAEADHLAGDLAALPAHRAARRAGGDRRAACRRPDPARRQRSRRGPGRRTPQRYYNSVVAINDQRRDRRRRRQAPSRARRRISAVLGLVPAARHRPDRRHADPVFGGHGTPSRSLSPTACGRRSSSATRSSSPTRSPTGVRGADFIVNVTNDAWFGDTPGPYQHFRSAQIRAADDRPAAGARRQQRHLGRHRFAWAASSTPLRSTCAARSTSRSTFPTPSPPLLGDPRPHTAILILALLALVGSQRYFIQQVEEDLTPQQAKCVL